MGINKAELAARIELDDIMDQLGHDVWIGAYSKDPWSTVRMQMRVWDTNSALYCPSGTKKDWMSRWQTFLLRHYPQRRVALPHEHEDQLPREKIGRVFPIGRKEAVIVLITRNAVRDATSGREESWDAWHSFGKDYRPTLDRSRWDEDLGDPNNGFIDIDPSSFRDMVAKDLRSNFTVIDGENP